MLSSKIASDISLSFDDHLQFTLHPQKGCDADYDIFLAITNNL